MTSSLTGAGFLSLGQGLAIALGADLGSAIVIRLLTLDLGWLMPLLMFAGGWLFLKCKDQTLKNIGLGAVGIALILISLDLISEAARPLLEASFLPSIASYLQADLVLAALVGLALTFALMSSVASILIGSAVFLSGAITFPVALAFVVGANIGSSLLPVWILRQASPAEKHLPYANLAVRGSFGVVAIVALILFEPALSGWGPKLGTGAPILFHVAFNAALMIVVPFTNSLSRQFEARLQNSPAADVDPAMPMLTNTLMANEIEVDDPSRAMRREMLSMLDLVSEMLALTSALFSEGYADAAEKTQQLEAALNERMKLIRTYFSHSYQVDAHKSYRKDMQVFLEYAVRLEHAGDTLSKRVLRTATRMRDEDATFTDEGRQDLLALAERALANTYLAFDVVSSTNSNEASRLIREKERFSRDERKFRRRHFKRIANGSTISLNSSDHHLELSSCLKEVNSKISTIAYPLLESGGQLHATRLIPAEGS